VHVKNPQNTERASVKFSSRIFLKKYFRVLSILMKLKEKLELAENQTANFSEQI